MDRGCQKGKNISDKTTFVVLTFVKLFFFEDDSSKSLTSIYN